MATYADFYHNPQLATDAELSKIRRAITFAKWTPAVDAAVIAVGFHLVNTRYLGNPSCPFRLGGAFVAGYMLSRSYIHIWAPSKHLTGVDDRVAGALDKKMHQRYFYLLNNGQPGVHKTEHSDLPMHNSRVYRE